MKTLYYFAKIIIIIFLFTSTLLSQLSFTVYTDKDVYDYGETIKLYAKVTNTADTTFEFLAGNYETCQAEFSFNDFNSWEYATCLPTSQMLTFKPHHSKTYSWEIEPQRLGLPNKEGTQTIIGNYYFGLADTIYIQAPKFIGGEVELSYKVNNFDSVNTIRKDLNANIMFGNDFGDVKVETWQIEGYDIDSLVQTYSNDSIFVSFKKSALIMYESIVDENPLDYYPLHVGDKWIYQIKHIPGWSGNETNYSLTREVLCDTIFSNSIKYYRIKESRDDTNLVHIYNERIDSIKGKIYRVDSLFQDNDERLIYDLSIKDGTSFPTWNLYLNSYLEEVIFKIENSIQQIFENDTSLKEAVLFETEQEGTIHGTSYILAKDIGIFYHHSSWLDGFDQFQFLQSAHINGVKYGDTTLVGIYEKTNNIQIEFSLSQNYPNPFNPTTTIEYTIPVGATHESLIQLRIFDVLGREIATLVNEIKKPGTYQVTFNAENLSSGIYFYEFRSGQSKFVGKMNLMK